MSTENDVDARALMHGVTWPEPGQSYLDRCARIGQVYLTSGHTSEITGTLGTDLSIEEGQEAARESIRRLLGSVHAAHGTLSGLRVVRMLTCVRAHPDFGELPQVVNGASDLIHQVFGENDGYHARSALGFTSLPGGAAVEIEAILEIKP